MRAKREAWLSWTRDQPMSYHPTMVANIHEAKTHLSRLVAAAEAGEEVVIARAGKPAVRMVPVEKEKLAFDFRVPGQFAGQIHIHPGFDEDVTEDDGADLDADAADA